MRTRFLHVLAPLFLVTAFLVVPLGHTASASEETDFKITVRARDAKFVGSSVGGARVTVTDKRTGDIIAAGVTHGGTGGSDKLMAKSVDRDAILVDDDTASLQFSLELIEPTPVTVAATGPLIQGQSLASVSEDMILIPGKDYTAGNGIMLELPGMAVDVLSPPPNMKTKFDAEQPVVLMANIMKMCGCRVEEGSPWPPERYEVEVAIYKDALLVTSARMEYAKEPGLFQRKLKFPAPGTYVLTVTAFDPVTKEAGVDSTSITLTP